MPLALRHRLRRALPQFNVGVPVFTYLALGWAAWQAPPGTLAGATVEAAPANPSLGARIGLAVLALAVAAFAMRYGLQPKLIPERRRLRHRIGHGVLALINAAVLGSLLLPILLAAFTGSAALAQLVWLSIPIVLVALLLWPIGLVLVWSAGGRPEAAQPDAT